MRCVPLLLLGWLFWMSWTAFPAVAQPYGTGYVDLWAGKSAAELEAARYRPSPRRADALPTRLINHNHLPPVRSQGGEPSCHYWAMVYYYRTWQEAREMGWIKPDPDANPERVMSHQFSYDLRDADLSIGCASYAAMASGFTDLGWPTYDQWKDALPHRIDGLTQLNIATDDGLATLRQHLADGDVAYFGLTVYDNFTYYNGAADGNGIGNEVYYAADGPVYDPPGPDNNPNHALTIIGYDRNKSYMVEGEPRQGAFVAVNSWGAGWGVNLPEVGTAGFIWFADDFLKEASLSGVVTIIQDRPTVEPTAIGIVEVSHPLAVEVDAVILGGDRIDPDWSCVVPIPDLLRSIDTRMPVDLSDYPVEQTGAFWLRVTDLDGIAGPGFEYGSATGWIREFSIERPDSPEPWTCRQTPAQTCDTSFGDISTYQFLEIGLFEDHDHDLAAAHLGLTANEHAVWGDFDRDGELEVVVSGDTYDSNNFVFINHMRMIQDPLSEFPLAATAQLPQVLGRLAGADFNRDGYLDLALEDPDAGAVRVFLYDVGLNAFHDSKVSLPVGALQGLAAIDFNNDGAMDIAFLPVDPGSGGVCDLQVWLNDGSGLAFTDTGWRPTVAPIGPSFMAGMAWADFNRDGWIDVVATTQITLDDGWGGTYDTYLLVFLANNQGLGLQQVAQREIEWNRDCSLAWGDLDGDGWPDLAHSPLNIVYRNDGGTAFTPLQVCEDFSFHGHAAWGDIDNDGKMELALAGEIADRESCVRVFDYDDAGNFINLTPNLRGLCMGSLAFLDADADGDLDLAAAGYVLSDGEASTYYYRNWMLFINRAAQPAGFGRPNAAPQPPTNIAIDHNPAQRTATVTWDAPAGDETAVDAMRYNLCVESFAGWNDIASDRDASPMLGNRPAQMLSPGRCGIVLNDLPGHSFRLAVQAVDAGLQTSAWSAPVQVAIGGGADPFDVNRDGKVNIADLIVCLGMVRGTMTMDAQKGDINADGQVSMADVRFVKSTLLGQSMPDRTLLDVATVDAAGATFSGDDFQLQIPAGAWTDPHDVAIFISTLDRPYGNRSVSPMLRLEGIPPDFAQPLTLRLKADGPLSGETLLACGADSRYTSGLGMGRGFYLVQPTAQDGDWFTFTLQPAVGVSEPSRASTEAGPSLTAAPAPTFSFETESGWFGLNTGNGIMTSDHFQVIYPAADCSPSDVISLGTSLEAAYAELHDPAKYNFDAAKLPTGKIQVKLLPMDAGKYGYFVGGGDRNAHSLEINSNELAGGAWEVTVWHEFCHMVQAGYYPASPGSAAASNPYWADEAGAAWFESNKGIPTVILDFLDAPFNGLVADAANWTDWFDTTKQNHGYGMASLYSYFVTKLGQTDFPKKLWTNIQSGDALPTAIRKAAGATDFAWWTDYLEALWTSRLVAGTFNYKYADAVKIANQSGGTFKLSDGDENQYRLVRNTIRDLSGRLVATRLDKSGLPAGSVLSHVLYMDDLSNVDLSLLKIPTEGSAFPNTLLGRGIPAGRSLRLDVPLDGITPDGKTGVVAMASDRNGTDFSREKDYQLYVAITRDQLWPLPDCNSYGPYSEWGVSGSMPIMSVSGYLDGPGLSNVRLSVSSFGAYLSAWVFGQPPMTYDLQVNVAIGSGAWDDYHVDGINHYELTTTYRRADGSETNSHVNSSSGHFTLTIDPDCILLGVDVRAHYTVYKGDEVYEADMYQVVAIVVLLT
jgi:hypothetical protein